MVQSRLTWVFRQVREGDGLALHLVGEAAQRDADLHLLRDVRVLVRWSLEHDGNLPVHIGLCELAVCLPGTSPEDDLDVICGSKSTTDMKTPPENKLFKHQVLNDSIFFYSLAVEFLLVMLSRLYFKHLVFYVSLGLHFCA